MFQHFWKVMSGMPRRFRRDGVRVARAARRWPVWALPPLLVAALLVQLLFSHAALVRAEEVQACTLQDAKTCPFEGNTASSSNSTSPSNKTILIIALGSRGHVQPQVAMGRHLQHVAKLGRVVIATNAEFEDLVRQQGLGVWPVDFSLLQAVQSPEFVAVKKSSFFNIVPRLKQAFGVMCGAWMRSIRDATEQLRPDFVAMTDAPFIAGGAWLMNRRPDVKWCLIRTVAGAPTREFLPPLGWRFASTGVGWLNKLVWNLGETLVVKGVAGPVVRTCLDRIGETGYDPSRLPSEVMIDDGVMTFYLYSSHMLPAPSDWPATQRVVGFARFEGSGEPISRQLSSFLDQDAGPSGKPVVYIGFGSMLAAAPKDNEHVKSVLQTVVHGARLAMAERPLRFVIHAYLTKNHPLDSWLDSWSMSVASEDLFIQRGPVSHAQLFSRCHLVVHHGGVGTTQATLYAGLPAIILPGLPFADQFFWASVLEKRGCAIKGEMFTKITPPRLSQLLCKAVDSLPRMSSNAREMAQKLRAEDAFTAVAEYVQSQLGPTVEESKDTL